MPCGHKAFDTAQGRADRAAVRPRPSDPRARAWELKWHNRLHSAVILAGQPPGRSCIRVLTLITERGRPYDRAGLPPPGPSLIEGPLFAVNAWRGGTRSPARPGGGPCGALVSTLTSNPCDFLAQAGEQLALSRDTRGGCASVQGRCHPLCCVPQGRPSGEPSSAGWAGGWGSCPDCRLDIRSAVVHVPGAAVRGLAVHPLTGGRCPLVHVPRSPPEPLPPPPPHPARGEHPLPTAVAPAVYTARAWVPPCASFHVSAAGTPILHTTTLPSTPVPLRHLADGERGWACQLLTTPTSAPPSLMMCHNQTPGVCSQRGSLSPPRHQLPLHGPAQRVNGLLDGCVLAKTAHPTRWRGRPTRGA